MSGVPRRTACRRLGVAIIAGLVLGAAVTTSAAMAQGSAVILLYHRFAEPAFPSTNIRIEQFEAHLDYLAENDFHVWPLERIVEHLQAGELLPDRTVAITIDDAYRSIYEEAYPRLKARDWPFTIFVATEDVDRDAEWSLTWDQVREMARNGGTIANHSHTHEHLARRSPEQSQEEWLDQTAADIERAQERLNEELEGAPPPLFAYPFGEYSEALAELVTGELGFEAAFGQHSGAVGKYSDLRALPRYALNERFGEMAEFTTRVESLHFPVTRLEPWDPVVEEAEPRPRMVVEFADGPRPGAINCFVSGQGRVELEEGPNRFAVQAPEPLPRGRSRYNCTASSDEAGRFYWFSQQWLVP